MKTCSECIYLDLNDSRSGNYYCTQNHQYYPLQDTTCGKFQYRTSTTSPISMGGNCYITTAVCEILKYPKDCYYLNFLRAFRDNYLKKEVDCFTMLEEYRLTGPKIVKNLEEDKNRVLIAGYLLNYYIIPSIEDIKKGNIEQAINIYIEMTNKLIDYYMINSNITEENYTDKLIKEYQRKNTK